MRKLAVAARGTHCRDLVVIEKIAPPLAEDVRCLGPL